MTRRAAIAVGGIAGLLVSSGLVWQSSSAAFVGRTTNPANNWAAGAVGLSDDDGATALFTVNGITPGYSGQKCITVTYSGNVATSVKLYAGSVSGTLGTYVNLTIERGTGGGFASCSGFVSTTTTYGPGTLGAFTSTSTTYGSGVGTWTPNTVGQSSTYRFSWSLQDDNAAAGKNVQLTFIWEAQSA